MEIENIERIELIRNAFEDFAYRITKEHADAVEIIPALVLLSFDLLLEMQEDHIATQGAFADIVDELTRFRLNQYRQRTSE